MSNANGYTIAKYGNSVLSSDGSVEIWVCTVDSLEEAEEYCLNPDCFYLHGKMTEDEFYGVYENYEDEANYDKEYEWPEEAVSALKELNSESAGYWNRDENGEMSHSWDYETSIGE